MSVQKWASSWVHGPVVYRFGETWFLYYVAHGNKRTSIEEMLRGGVVGVATSVDLLGPWIPFENNPILSPRSAYWDHYSTTNISVFELPDGRYGMVYKGRGDERGSQRIEMATADTPLGPWERGDSPNFCPELNGLALEDICVWTEQGLYLAAVKTFATVHKIPASATILLYSESGFPDSWKIHPMNPIVWDTNLQFDDELISKRYQHVEFPFVYVEDGQAIALINGVHPTGHNSPGAMNVLRLVKPWDDYDDC